MIPMWRVQVPAVEDGVLTVHNQLLRRGRGVSKMLCDGTGTVARALMYSKFALQKMTALLSARCRSPPRRAPLQSPVCTRERTRHATARQRANRRRFNSGSSRAARAVMPDCVMKFDSRD